MSSPEGNHEAVEKVQEDEKKTIMVLLMGPPGSGKSTFCDHVMRASTRPWVRVCQDTIGNGKAGTKNQCLTSATTALKQGKSVFIDRCNMDKEQRADFLILGGPQIEKHAIVLDLPAKLCISRSVGRTGHEGKLQGGKAAAVVNRMLQKKELPKLDEGFSRIMFCQNEKDVEDAINTYSALGPSASLPSGCFGQKNPKAKIQLGIMNFLKKVDVPSNEKPDKKFQKHHSPNETPRAEDICPAQNHSPNETPKEEEICPAQNHSPNETPKEEDICPAQNHFPNESPKEDDICPAEAGHCPAPHDPMSIDLKGCEDLLMGSSSDTSSLDSIPTLAFASVSTADFQFNLEKASDIIVEKVEEFVKKEINGRLVLVDLSKGSKILSRVRTKASDKNIDSNKFFTFVGDITQLKSKGGLLCNVIANAANWRLKPGGGGVNAAIFNAAGPEFEIATKERAITLSPGKAVAVPLPSTSPLFSNEGVTHVIHVLGPNMNPQRPNCLNNDYVKGCEILREAYSSLFECFTSIIDSQSGLPKGSNERSMNSQDHKIKREVPYGSVRDQKPKDSQIEHRHGARHPGNGNNSLDKRESGGMTKAWGTWAQALYQIAMHPEKHASEILEMSSDVVVLNDVYPKAQKHLLVLARVEGLDRLADVREGHLVILKTMHAVGLKWAEKYLCENGSLVFRLGYHSEPSMRQLHLHVVSQDFDSKHLKNKKHWNSFNTPFFLDSVDVIEEVSKSGKATINDDDNFYNMELRCNRCRSAHPNIPRLKKHISSCKAPFPANLLENGRLIQVKVDHNA